MNEMNVYERFAVSQFLSSYPEDVSFDELCDMMRDYDENVIAWDPFFDSDPEELIDAISNMIDALQDTFVPKEVV